MAAARKQEVSLTAGLVKKKRRRKRKGPRVNTGGVWSAPRRRPSLPVVSFLQTASEILDRGISCGCCVSLHSAPLLPLVELACAAASDGSGPEAASSAASFTSIPYESAEVRVSLGPYGCRWTCVCSCVRLCACVCECDVCNVKCVCVKA